MKLFRDIGHILVKEAINEWRTRETLSSMAVFGALVLIVFNFAFPPGAVDFRLLAPGILWVAFIFSGILGMNRSMAQEKEEGCLQGLLLTPADRGALFLGKMLSNFIFLTAIETIIFVIFALFFNVSFFQGLGGIALITLLGSFGFITLGTLFATIAVQTRFQEVLLPILLIPLVAPVLIGAVKCTGGLLAGKSLSDLAFWLKFLATFDATFLIASFLAFEYVVQE